jgi:hypothetical protein
MVTQSLTSEAQLFAQRLREAMLNAGLKASPTVLAHEFNLCYWGQGISVHAARNWLLGKSLPMQDKLVVLADFLKVDASELRFGVGERMKASRRDVGIQSMGMHDRAMLCAYAKLPDDKQRLVRQLIHAL